MLLARVGARFVAHGETVLDMSPVISGMTRKEEAAPEHCSLTVAIVRAASIFSDPLRSREDRPVRRSLWLGAGRNTGHRRSLRTAGS